MDGAEFAVQNFGAEFPILFTARDSSVPQAYDVFDLHGDGLAAASVFVVDRQGRLTFSWVSDVYSDRLSANEILAELEKLPA